MARLPLDCDGDMLKVNDEVAIRCRVVAIIPNKESDDVIATVIQPDFFKEVVDTFNVTCNSRFLKKIPPKG